MDKPVLVPDTSPSLLIRIRDPEDRHAWMKFERIYGGVVRKYCGYWNLQASDADDVVQDVLAAVAQGIRTFDYDPQKGRFRGWLGTIASNKIKNMISRKTRRNEVTLSKASVKDELDKYADPDANWTNEFCEAVLKEAYKIVGPEFTENIWKCFELTWIKNQPPDDVARKVGVAVHSVYVNKSRVLKRLKQVIQELSDDLAIDCR